MKILKYLKIVNLFLIKFIFILFLAPNVLFAAGDTIDIPKNDWSFSGLFGTFDRSAQQRGLQVYKEVCSGCHGMRLIAYRNLKALGYNDAEVKAFAADNEITDGPNDDGEMFERPARPSDKFVSPYPNEQAARAANGGAYPPDLSLIVKARVGGADYIHALLSGYRDAPKSKSVPDGMYYNIYYPGNLIGMPQPLYEEGVDYADGTKATEEQMSKDVSAFLAWASEPELEERKKLGISVICFLLVLTILSYFAMKQIWAPIKRRNQNIS